MKKGIIVFLLVSLLQAFVICASFEDLLRNSLSNDPDYLSAKLEYENSLFERKQKDSWFIPYITIGDQAQSMFGAVFEGDEIDYSVNLPVSITFKDVYGFNFSIGNGWHYNLSNNEWTDSGWSLTISRELFTNLDLDDLTILQKITSARWNLLDARNNVFIRLINEIFSDFYYRESLEILNNQLEILERQVSVIQDKYQLGIVSAEEFLQTQKELQTLTQELTDLQRSRMSISRSYSKEDFDQMIAVMDRITSKLPSEDEAIQIAKERADVKAKEIALEIAKREYERAYQAFLPNPTVAVKVSQDPSTSSGFSISFGFSLSYTILDRGERNYEFTTASQNYKIRQLIYDETVSSLERDIKGALLAIKVAEYSRKASELDLRLAQIDYDRIVKATEYFSEDDIQKARLEVKSAEIAVLKAQYDLLLAKVNYLKLLGYDLVAILGGQVDY